MSDDDWGLIGLSRRVVGDKPVAQMFHPGKCLRCGAIYDGGSVTVTARYTDCSVWTAPCCGSVVDDRPRGWGGGFEPLSRREREWLS